MPLLPAPKHPVKARYLCLPKTSSARFASVILHKTVGVSTKKDLDSNDWQRLFIVGPLASRCLPTIPLALDKSARQLAVEVIDDEPDQAARAYR